MKLLITNSTSITKALYGKYNNYIDVLGIINDYINNKKNIINVSNETFFNDPYQGITKELKLIVDDNLYVYYEGDTIQFDFTDYKFGSRGNLINNVIMTGLSNSYMFNTINYGNDSIISYEDNNYTNKDSIYIYASTSIISGTECIIGKLYPESNIENNKRTACCNIALGAFNFIYIRNNSKLTNSNVVCSLFSK
jgi:hypothetical protein